MYHNIQHAPQQALSILNVPFHLNIQYWLLRNCIFQLPQLRLLLTFVGTKISTFRVSDQHDTEPISKMMRRQSGHVEINMAPSYFRLNLVVSLSKIFEQNDWI